MKHTRLFYITIFLIIVSYLTSVTGCKWVSFGGDFVEIISESLDTKIVFYEDNPLVKNDALKFERSYRIGSRCANISTTGNDVSKFADNHIGYKILGWKYLCNALDNENTTLPADIKLNSNGCIDSLKIPVDSFWVYAVWTEATDIPYKVIHLIQNSTLDGYEEYKIENLIGTTNKKTEAKALEIEGYEPKAFEQVNISPKGDSEVRIYYDRKKINVTVVYNGNTKELAGYYGNSITEKDIKISDFAENGYVFEKWIITYEDGSTSEDTQEFFVFTKDKAVYTAVWKEKTYNISYVLQPSAEITVSDAKWKEDFTPIKERTTSSEIELPASDNISRKGYTFDGWYEDSDFTKSLSKIKAGYAADITLYGKWTANIYSITYDLSGGELTGELLSPVSFTIEDNVDLPESASIFKDGYKFDGWYSDSELTSKVEKIIAGENASNLTLYAKWILAPAYAGGIEITYPESGDALIHLMSIVDNVAGEITITVDSILIPDSLTVASYEWYFDGDIITGETSGTVSLNNLTAGYHQVTVLVTDSGNNRYSADIEIRIKK